MISQLRGHQCLVLKLFLTVRKVRWCILLPVIAVQDGSQYNFVRVEARVFGPWFEGLSGWLLGSQFKSFKS